MADTPFSQFPSATPDNADVVVGLHSGNNAKFTFANIITAIRNGLENIFVPNTRKVNNIALSADITLDASDVGAYELPSGGIPKSDLASGVQDSLDDADSAYQLPSGGIPATDLASGVIPTVPAISTATPQMDGTGAAGSTGQVSDAGHTHPSDSSRVPVYGMGENLLDNWYFGNPVNQRGKSSYAVSSVTDYSLDRWADIRIAVAIPDNTGIVLSSGITGYATGYLRQYISCNLIGKQVTISALILVDNTPTLVTQSGTLVANTQLESSEVSNFKISVRQISASSNVECFLWKTQISATVKVVAAKLELGTEQTLAHLEGSTWVLNEIPDYEYELYRCITSTADPSDTYANKSLATEQQLAYVETGTTTSRAYSVGEYFCWNGLLYRVTTAISSGGTITPGTNCEQVTGGGLNALKDSITMKYHGDSNLSTSPGTTSLINTGIKFTTNTELILFKVHTSASGTLKININSASVIDMNMNNGQDYATFLVRSLTPGTELQVQYLGTSTANISSYYIVSIPLPGIGI